MNTLVVIAAILAVYALAALIVYGRRLWRRGGERAGRRERPERKCPQYWF
jgi:hypothetical protein